MRETLTLTIRQTVNIVFGDFFLFCSAYILIYRLGPIDALNESINGWLVLCVAATAAAGCRIQSSLLWYWTSCCRKNMYLIFASNPMWCAPHTNIIWTNCTVCCFNVSESVEILCVCCRCSMMRLHHPWNGRERKREWGRAIERERICYGVRTVYWLSGSIEHAAKHAPKKRDTGKEYLFFYQICSLISHCSVIALFKFNVRRSISGGMMWWIQVWSSTVPIIIIIFISKVFTLRLCVFYSDLWMVHSTLILLFIVCSAAVTQSQSNTSIHRHTVLLSDAAESTVLCAWPETHNNSIHPTECSALRCRYKFSLQPIFLYFLSFDVYLFFDFTDTENSDE